MISIRMNEASESALREFARFEGLSVSEYVRNLINEKLEEQYDLSIGQQALDAFNSNPVTYTMDEVFKG